MLVPWTVVYIVLSLAENRLNISYRKGINDCGFVLIMFWNFQNSTSNGRAHSNVPSDVPLVVSFDVSLDDPSYYPSYDPSYVPLPESVLLSQDDGTSHTE